MNKFHQIDPPKVTHFHSKTILKKFHKIFTPPPPSSKVAHSHSKTILENFQNPK